MSKLARGQKLGLASGLALGALFVVFTLVVALVDVSDVGLSSINHAVWRCCGAQKGWRVLTDVLGYVLIVAVLVIGAVQVWQWVRRKSLRAIDRNWWAFDAVCLALVAVYVFFEIVVVNCRPELADGVAKASYPSTHAMLFATLLPLIIWQVWRYVPRSSWRIVLTVVLSILLVVGVVGRLLSGVHWFTDIVAGVIMGGCLNSFYWLLAAGTKRD